MFQATNGSSSFQTFHTHISPLVVQCTATKNRNHQPQILNHWHYDGINKYSQYIYLYHKMLQQKWCNKIRYSSCYLVIAMIFQHILYIINHLLTAVRNLWFMIGYLQHNEPLLHCNSDTIWYIGVFYCWDELVNLLVCEGEDAPLLLKLNASVDFKVRPWNEAYR